MEIHDYYSDINLVQFYMYISYFTVLIDILIVIIVMSNNLTSRR